MNWPCFVWKPKNATDATLFPHNYEYMGNILPILIIQRVMPKYFHAGHWIPFQKVVNCTWQSSFRDGGGGGNHLPPPLGSTPPRVKPPEKYPLNNKICRGFQSTTMPHWVLNTNLWYLSQRSLHETKIVIYIIQVTAMKRAYFHSNGIGNAKHKTH